jgi:O-antigen/teichoic acid export membrane protein
MIKAEIFKLSQNILVKIAGVFVAFYFTYLIASGSNQEDSGQFFFFVNAVTFLSALVRYGTDTYAIKFIASIGGKYLKLRSYKLSSIFCIITFIELCLLLPLFILLRLYGVNIVECVILMLAIYFQSLYALCCNILYGRGKSTHASFLINVFLYLVFIILFFVLKEGSLTSLLLLYLTSVTASFLTSLYFVKRHVNFYFVTNLPYIKLVIKRLYPYFKLSFIDQLSKWYPIIVSKFFVVGSAYTAINVSYRYSLVVGMVSIVAAPLASRIFSQQNSASSHNELFKQLGVVILFIFFASLFVFVATSFFAYEILHQVNEELVGYTSLFILFGVSGITYSCYLIVYNFMIMVGLQQQLNKIVLVVFITSNAISSISIIYFPLYFAVVFMLAANVTSLALMYISYKTNNINNKDLSK